MEKSWFNIVFFFFCIGILLEKYWFTIVIYFFVLEKYWFSIVFCGFLVLEKMAPCVGIVLDSIGLILFFCFGIVLEKNWINVRLHWFW